VDLLTRDNNLLFIYTKTQNSTKISSSTIFF